MWRHNKLCIVDNRYYSDWFFLCSNSLSSINVKYIGTKNIMHVYLPNYTSFNDTKTYALWTLHSVWFISVALTTFRSPNDTLQQHNGHQNTYILGRRYLPLLKSCEQIFLFTLLLPCLMVSCATWATRLFVSSSPYNSNDSFTVAIVLSCSANPQYLVGLSNWLTRFAF